MAPKVKSKLEREADRQLRILGKILEGRGISVRREKLSRGPAFRVKSGECIYTGKPHLFVDRRLPSEQQISLILDFFQECEISLEESEVEELSDKVRRQLENRISQALPLEVESAEAGQVEAELSEESLTKEVPEAVGDNLGASI
jgi:hypothetical protein